MTRGAPGDRSSSIEVRGLAKVFGVRPAVRGVSFEVARGETFGLLGPNGAGKTTTISMLATIVEPTEGGATIAGHSITTRADLVRQSIGIVFQATTLDNYLSALENLQFHAVLYALPRQGLAERIHEVLDLVGLWERRSDRVRSFSGGMKRRLEIARALLHGPRVLLLDEPTVGLDPQTRVHIWNYIERLKTEQAVTILVTTHYMDEAEHCDRIAIIDDGELVALDAPAALKAMVGMDAIHLHTADDAEAKRRLEERFGLSAAEADGEIVTHVAHGEQFVPELCAGLGLPVFSVRVVRPTLDDVFMTHTGRGLRDPKR